MIRVVLLGRTGNNLFQYALGQVLARKHGVPLVMDASWFNQQGWREVSHFLTLPLNAKIVRRFSLATRALRNITGKHYWEYRGEPIIRESIDDQKFDSSILESPSNCTIFGYFQSPLYFASIAELLRSELNGLLTENIGVSPALRDKLSSPSSIAVHVRRGDYLLNPTFDVCNQSYYKIGMTRLRERIPGAHFHIFSDDPVWCRSEFKSHDVEVMEFSPDRVNPLHDLHLMSLASHHLIANSTYSWWGAWLGLKPGQTVMMPDRWYAGGTKAPIEEKRLPHWEILHR
jgi:hypothetical protein